MYIQNERKMSKDILESISRLENTLKAADEREGLMLDELAMFKANNARLLVALKDAINSEKGVIPESAKLYV